MFQVVWEASQRQQFIESADDDHMRYCIFLRHRDIWELRLLRLLDLGAPTTFGCSRQETKGLAGLARHLHVHAVQHFAVDVHWGCGRQANSSGFRRSSANQECVGTCGRTKIGVDHGKIHINYLVASTYSLFEGVTSKKGNGLRIVQVKIQDIVHVGYFKFEG